MKFFFEALKIEWDNGAYFMLSLGNSFASEYMQPIQHIYGGVLSGIPSHENLKSSICFAQRVEHNTLFQPIRIFENVDYNVEVRLPKAKQALVAELTRKNNKCWPFLNRRLHRILKMSPARLWIDDNQGGTIIGGYLNPLEFLGAIDVTFEYSAVSLLLEVQSRKIEYEQEYRLLLEHIAEYHLGLIHDVGAISGLSLEMSPHSYPDLQSCYFHLRRIMDRDRLPSAIEKILANPASALTIHSELTPLGKSRFVSPAQLIRNQHNMGLHTGGPFSSLFKGFSPSAIMMDKKFDTYDINENRYVKKFLVSISMLLAQLEHAARNENNQAILLEITKWQEEVADWSSRSTWKSVGTPSNVLYNSQKMMRLAGYREVLHLEYELSEALRLPLQNEYYTDDLVVGDVKPVHVLYEYWCYFIIRNALKELYGSESSNGYAYIKKSEHSMTITLKTSSNSNSYSMWSVVSDSNVFDVYLFFHKSFLSAGDSLWGDWYGSYSMKFDPDISIAIRHNGVTHWINFDAKYRMDIKIISDIELKYDFKKEDLNKMHTYRDAILGTRGAYILYPGKEATQGNIFVRQPQTIDALSNFPNVGAFCLRPETYQCQSKIIKQFIATAIEDLTCGGHYVEELGCTEI